MEMDADKFLTELNLVIQGKSNLPRRLRDLVIQRGEWHLKEGHIRMDDASQHS